MKTRLVLLLTFLWFSLGWSQLKIYCLDVNQGDATMIIAPNGKTLLIDTGLKKDADEIIELLDKEHISAIDYALLTHFDSDHRGGFALLKEKKVVIRNPVYDYGGAAPSSYKKVVISRQVIKPGDTIPIDPSVTVTCLTAKRKLTDGSTAPRRSESSYAENQNSVTLHIQYKGFDFFVGGDLTENVENAMVDAGIVPDVDVYHVSHHGSNTSSTEEFIKELSPEVSIVSNGSKYNHPTTSVVDILNEYDSFIYQTNRNTSTKSSPDPPKNATKAFTGDWTPTSDKGTILIEVGDGSYTVSFERNQYKKGDKYVVD